jgi:hypothetical protein
VGVVIRRYRVTGIYGGSSSREDLCEYHANVKKFFAREVKATGTELPADAKCDDCRPAQGPYVLDRVIAEADAKERTAEPAPPKVLRGQGRLFK